MIQAFAPTRPQSYPWGLFFHKGEGAWIHTGDPLSSVPQNARLCPCVGQGGEVVGGGSGLPWISAVTSRAWPREMHGVRALAPAALTPNVIL